MQHDTCEAKQFQSMNQNLPTPQFSKANPYWRDKRIAGVNQELQPRLSWQDFLYASAWEIESRDLHAAYCVRSAMTFSIKLQMYSSLRQRIKEILNEE